MGLGDSLLHLRKALKGKAMAAADANPLPISMHAMQTGRKAYRFRPVLFGVVGGYLLLPLLPLPPLFPLPPVPPVPLELPLIPPPVLLLPASLLPPKPPLLPPELPLPPLLPPEPLLPPAPLPLMPPELELEPEALFPLCPDCELLSSSWFWSFRLGSFGFLSAMLSSLLDALANACRMPSSNGRVE
jgi:hypothetical protein